MYDLDTNSVGVVFLVTKTRVRIGFVRIQRVGWCIHITHLIPLATSPLYIVLRNGIGIGGIFLL